MRSKALDKSNQALELHSISFDWMQINKLNYISLAFSSDSFHRSWLDSRGGIL